MSIESGALVGPDYDLSVFVIGSDFIGYLEEDKESVREAVRFWVRRGFTSIKAANLSGDMLEAVIDEAHKLGVKVTADLGYLIKSHREAVDLGIDQIEHLVAQSIDWKNLGPDDEQVQTMMQHYIDNEVAISTTMSEWDDQLAVEPEEVVALLSDKSRQRYEHLPFGPFGESLKDGTQLKKQQAMALAFWRKGGTATLGTDAVFGGNFAGYANLRSIELTVDAGIPNLEVIKMATLNGAEAIGIADDRGTIAVGKRADLIVIKGDPSVNIKDIYHIETVFKKGIGYNPQALKDSVKGTVGR